MVRRRRQRDPLPLGPGCQLQKSTQIRQLLNLGSHHCLFGEQVIADGMGAPEKLRGCAGDGLLLPQDLALANESGSEFSGSTTFSGGAMEDDGVATILDDALRLGIPEGAAHLSNTLRSTENRGLRFKMWRSQIPPSARTPGSPWWRLTAYIPLTTTRGLSGSPNPSRGGFSTSMQTCQSLVLGA